MTNQDLLDQLYDNELDNRQVEYVAYVKYDGVPLARVSGHDLDGLSYELHKLERAVDKQTNENVQMDWENGVAEPDYDAILKDSR